MTARPVGQSTGRAARNFRRNSRPALISISHCSKGRPAKNEEFCVHCRGPRGSICGVRDTYLLRIAAVRLACRRIRGSGARSHSKKTSNGDASKADFTPDEEAKLAAFKKKVSEAKRKLLSDYMAAKLNALVKATGLDQTGRKLLEDAASRAVDECLKKSDSYIDKLFRTEFQLHFQTLPAAARAQIFKQLDTQAEAFAKFSETQSENWPTDEPEWKDGVKKALTATQSAAWESAESAKVATVDKQTTKYLEAIVRLAGDQERERIAPKAAQIQEALKLPKDRVDKLNAFVESLISKYAGESRARTEKWLLAMGDDERKETINRQGYSWQNPDEDDGWDQGLAKLLSADELTRIQVVKEERKMRRVRAMGGIMLALLDEKIRFTQAQRPKLEPIIQSLVKNDSRLSAEREAGNYFSYSLPLFYSAAASGWGSEIKAILDPIQWRHWQVLSETKPMPDESDGQQTALQLPPPDGVAKPEPPVEPEEIERAISDFLAKKSDGMRETLMAEQIAKAEDVVRVAHLPPDSADRLQTAARGVADESLTRWKASVEEMVRSNLRDISPINMKARLANLQNYQFGENFLTDINGRNNEGVSIFGIRY